MGRTNMTIETIADMVWALDHEIKIEIFDPRAVHGLNDFINADQAKRLIPLPGRPNTTTNSGSVPDLDELLLGHRNSPIPAT
jgi:hypothetical protein